MTTKDFSAPARQNISDSNSPMSDILNMLNDVQPVSGITNQAPPRRKSHNPLTVASSKFLVKSPPFFQDSLGVPFESTDVTHSCVASEPLNCPANLPIIEHLDLTNFKIKPCSLNTQHNHKHCPFYHNAKDRKRPGYFYSAELCDYAEKDGVTCPGGDMCSKAHNRVEQLYRPEKYKTKFCTFYPNNLEKCEYGTFCSFAHNENDIVVDLIHNYEYDDDFYMFHFKTVWCPFNLTQHDKALCVYAHNWQDYRRKPNVHIYDPTPCPNWKSTDFILNYEDGCQFKEKCTKCHGWKEHEYHPLNYKSKACSAGKNCVKGRDCPHYHSMKERRTINSNVLNRVFRFVPRNRIVTNTFKVRSEERPIYQAQSQNIGVSSTSTSSLTNYPSLTLSHENDSLLDQYSSLSDQVMNNPSRGNMLSFLNEIPPKNVDFRMREREDIVDMKHRKQSYDFESTRLLKSNSTTGNNSSRTEKAPLAIDQNTVNLSSKTRRWSTNEEGGFNHESDRLFREIMASMNKEPTKLENMSSPVLKNSEEKDEIGKLKNKMKLVSWLGPDVELKDTMLDKILENDDI